MNKWEETLTRSEWLDIRTAEQVIEDEDFAEFASGYEEYEAQKAYEAWLKDIGNDERYEKYCFDQKFMMVEEADVGTSVKFKDGSIWYCQQLTWYNPKTEDEVSLFDIYERMLEEGAELDETTSPRYMK